MKTATLEDLISDYNDIANKKNIPIPYNLHDGLTKIQNAFGTASNVMDWLRAYRGTRHIHEK